MPTSRRAQGRKHYRADDFDRAIRSLRESLAANEGDKLPKVYIARCERLKVEAPRDWDSVWRMTEK